MGKVNEGRLQIWNNWKMKFFTSIHNDDMKCFHMAIQEIDKFIIMGYISYEDHALIKRWQVSKKMNVTNEMFKDEKKGIIIKK